MSAGIAMAMPKAVLYSAIEMPWASCWGLAPPGDCEPKISIIPITVPNRPSSGEAVAMVVALAAGCEPEPEVDPDDGGPLLPKIKETDRSSRSGKLALMGAYRWPIGTGKVSAGLQIGVAIDTDDPGFFVGPTLRWGFVALGWGYTLQSVKELNGQIVGQDLAKGDVVKLRDHWQDDTFWSLSISLRNLPFFKGKG